MRRAWLSGVDALYERLVGPRGDLEELLCVVVALGWGVMLACPGSALAASNVFSGMLALCPEWAWTIALLTGGSLGLFGYWRRIRVIRKAAAFAGFLFWLLVCVFLVFREHMVPVPGLIIFPALSVISFLDYCKHGGMSDGDDE